MGCLCFRRVGQGFAQCGSGGKQKGRGCLHGDIVTGFGNPVFQSGLLFDGTGEKFGESGFLQGISSLVVSQRAHGSQQDGGKGDDKEDQTNCDIEARAFHG